MERVPDDPVWIEARAALLDPASRIFGDVEAFAVRSDALRLGALVGACSRSAIREAFADIEDAGDDLSALWAVVAPQGFTQEARAALTGWSTDEASILREPDVGGASMRPVTAECAARPCRRHRLARAPAERSGRRVGRRARALEIGAAWLDGRAVSFCYAACESETLWDISINTVAEYRRRGLAGECVAWLGARMRARGKRAVWGARSANQASKQLASKLGFEPWGPLFLYENWAGDPALRN